MNGVLRHLGILDDVAGSGHGSAPTHGRPPVQISFAWSQATLRRPSDVRTAIRTL